MLMTISQRLQQAMKAAGMNQKELAAAVGVKPPSVNGWLSGKAKFLRGENLLAAAAALSVSADWLATGAGRMAIEDSNTTVTNSLHTSQYGPLDPATLVEAVKLVRELFMVQEGLELEIKHLERNCTHLAYAYSYLSKKKAQTQRVQTDGVVVEFSKYVRSQGAKSGERLGADAAGHRKRGRRDTPGARDGGAAAAKK